MPTHLDRDALAYDPEDYPDQEDTPSNTLPALSKEWLEEGTTAHPDGATAKLPSQEERQADEDAQAAADDAAPQSASTTQTASGTAQRSRAAGKASGS